MGDTPSPTTAPSSATAAAAAHRGPLCNVLSMSASFFCIFTAFNAIQNLETTIVSGRCRGCDVYCDSAGGGQGAARQCFDNGSAPSDVDSSSVVCSWTSASSGVKYCANYGGSCSSACPNADDGGAATGAEVGGMEFDTCGASVNVGSIALGVLYATFTACCLVGPYFVRALGGPKWTMFTAFCLYSLFCAANVVVAWFPDVVTLQWAALLPFSALLGLAAAFLYPAQGRYLTVMAARYAAASGRPPAAALGLFNGVYFCAVQSTQISGNLAQSMLVDRAGWSNTSLMVFYLAFSAAGVALMACVEGIDAGATAAEAGAGECGGGAAAVAAVPPSPPASLPPSLSGSPSCALSSTSHPSVVRAHHLPLPPAGAGGARAPGGCAAALAGVAGLWADPRMACLIPVMAYVGVELGFYSGDFTSNWVVPSLGEGSIGYVMAAFGGADMAASLLLGRLSDRVGRVPVLLGGLAIHLATLAVLYGSDVGHCDRRWALLVGAACAWGVGDAALNTQLGALLGDFFRDEVEDAFANFYMWQSLTAAMTFFLNLSPDLMSPRATVGFVAAFCAAGAAGTGVGAALHARAARRRAAALLGDCVSPTAAS